MVTTLQTAGVIRYQKEIRGFPLLQEGTPEKHWREYADREAVRKILTSHLRLVIKVARSFRGYGLPFSESLSEGNVGLMQSADRFDSEYQDCLVDERPNQEQQLAQNDEFELRCEALCQALSTLGDRERYVLEMRRLGDEPLPLEFLAAAFRVSRERVRQIETQAFEKVCKAVRQLADCEIVTTGSSAVSPRTRNLAVVRQDSEHFSRQFNVARGKRGAGRRSSQFAASGAVGRLQKWRADWKYSQTLSR
jgi:DNA-directed RNA polymerase sigma subunit (sigma70/sigma32)